MSGPSAYERSLTALSALVDDLHELMHDPFKAPELTVFALPVVQSAMWNVQVEYAAMGRARENAAERLSADRANVRGVTGEAAPPT